jgi:divalent metal cation (Fe/Co/Zn/Cd) transporter
VGLLGVKLGEWLPDLAFLGKADAVAALGVAGIVIVISLQLGKRAVAALIDTAPAGTAEQIERIVESVPGVLDCHDVRVRPSGAELFANIHVVMDDEIPLGAVHSLSHRIEQKVQEVFPSAHVMIHPEPRNEIEADDAEDQRGAQ